MATHKNFYTYVRGKQKFLEIYVWKNIIFDSIGWWSKIRADSLERDIVIVTDEDYDNIIFNGKKIKINH